MELVPAQSHGRARDVVLAVVVSVLVLAVVVAGGLALTILVAEVGTGMEGLGYLAAFGATVLLASVAQVLGGTLLCLPLLVVVPLTLTGHVRLRRLLGPGRCRVLAVVVEAVALS